MAKYLKCIIATASLTSFLSCRGNSGYENESGLSANSAEDTSDLDTQRDFCLLYPAKAPAMEVGEEIGKLRYIGPKGNDRPISMHEVGQMEVNFTKTTSTGLKQEFVYKFEVISGELGFFFFDIVSTPEKEREIPHARVVKLTVPPRKANLSGNFPLLGELVIGYRHITKYADDDFNVRCRFIK